MTSGVPQASVLGPLLFVIVINGLDENLGGTVSKFAEYTRIGGIVDSEEGYLELQRDLDQLGQWAEEWQMEFNLDKYEVMQLIDQIGAAPTQLMVGHWGELQNKEISGYMFIAP